jgi:hypothetical protein
MNPENAPATVPYDLKAPAQGRPAEVPAELDMLATAISTLEATIEQLTSRLGSAQNGKQMEVPADVAEVAVPRSSAVARELATARSRIDGLTEYVNRHAGAIEL